MTYETFSDSLDDAISLLKLSEKSEIASERDGQLVLGSAVVLSVAFWQYYHEGYVKDISQIVMQRCRKSELPELIREKVGNWLVHEHNIENKPYNAASLVWEFTGEKWLRFYIDYVQHMVSRLNTPNTKNINALYRSSVLGIENIADCWSNVINDESPSDSINYILDIRHKIAHGNFNTSLSHEQVLEMIECLRKNAEQSHEYASSKVPEIVEGSGICYSLDDFDLSGLIKWLAANPDELPFAVADLSTVSTNWYANHKKLSHVSWDLLEGSATARRTTEKFRQFVAGEVSIPYEIISFGGKDSTEKSGTKMVYFKDL